MRCTSQKRVSAILSNIVNTMPIRDKSAIIWEIHSTPQLACGYYVRSNFMHFPQYEGSERADGPKSFCRFALARGQSSPP
jgi:hypothetical protein